MTGKKEIESKKSLIKADKAIFCASIILLVITTVFFSDKIKFYAGKGLLLCGKTIIPSLFPFMIFSDLLISFSAKKSEGLASRIYEKAFGVNSVSSIAFICGAICGFPIGAICVKRLYDTGIVDKEDAEYLLGLCSMPSMAFIISGVGVGMMRSRAVGVFLFCTTFISTLIAGLIFRPKERKIKVSREISEQRFDFVKSVKESGYAMIGICSFIIFFSVIVGFINELVKNEYLDALLSSFFEIGNAAFQISLSTELPMLAKLFLLELALGFSGISVLMQTASVVSSSKLSVKKYFFMKLTIGLIAGLLVLLFLII